MDEVICEITGKVKTVHRKPGKESMEYAFIRPDSEVYDDVFVHYKEIEPWKKGFKDLYEGTKVKFELKKNKRNDKYYAANLKIIRTGLDADDADLQASVDHLR